VIKWIIILIILIIPCLSFATGNNSVLVSASVLSKGKCTFSTGTSNLSFGTLDPGNPVDKNASTTVYYTCQANGTGLISINISKNDGLYSTGPSAPRMRNIVDTSMFLPYTMSLNPTAASVPKNVQQTLTITGTVLGSSFENQIAGNYSDTVVVHIAP